MHRRACPGEGEESVASERRSPVDRESFSSIDEVRERCRRLLSGSKLSAVALAWVVAAAAAAAAPGAEAYNICTCQCCYSGICIDRPNSEEWNGTFQVPGCSDCTKSLCFEHIKKPIGSCDEVSATCVDYDTYWRLTVIVLIVFLLSSLLVIGCLKDVPVVKRVFKLT